MGSDKGDERLILVARVASAFGVRGEVRITTFTGDPMALTRYKSLRRQDGSPALTVQSARPVDGGVIARCPEIADKTAADAMRGMQLFVARSDFSEPDEDEYYLADLIGLAAVSPQGVPIGTIKAVPNFGAGDLLEIAPAEGGATWYLAFTREAVPSVDLAAGQVVIVRPIEVE